MQKLTDEELFETGALLLEAANAAREAHKDAVAANKAVEAERCRARAAVLLSSLRKITAELSGAPTLRPVQRPAGNVVSLA